MSQYWKPNCPGCEEGILIEENSLTDEQIKTIAKNVLKSDNQDVEGKPWALATIMV